MEKEKPKTLATYATGTVGRYDLDLHFTASNRIFSPKRTASQGIKKVNTTSISNHYPLPITKNLLEIVAKKEAYSFLDGFSGYNQVTIHPNDQHKMAFATKFGIYAYRVMPFVLTNALATFQRLMNHAFKEHLQDFLEVYMDDLCVHSNSRANHILHLIKVFEKYQTYRICLNPKKCVFMVRQGRILGHIVSKNGISTNLDKIKIIVDLPRPKNVKEVQNFMGRCGYYRWFIYMYDMIAKPIYSLVNMTFEWIEECETSFQKLKQAIISNPMLKALNYNKIFRVHVDVLAYAIGCILA